MAGVRACVCTVFMFVFTYVWVTYLLSERKPEIEDCLKQMESCFNLLFPRFIDDVAISSERAPKVPVSAVVTLQRMTSCSSSASLGTGEEGSLDDERDMLGCADGAGAAGRVGEEPQECCSSSLKGGEPSSGSGAGREPGSHVVRSIKGKEKAVVGKLWYANTSLPFFFFFFWKPYLHCQPFHLLSTQRTHVPLTRVTQRWSGRMCLGRRRMHLPSSSTASPRTAFLCPSS